MIAKNRNFYTFMNQNSAMKRFSLVISLLLVLGFVYWSFYALMPQSITKADAPLTEFSTERALTHVKAIAQKPHYIGTKAHEEVRNYIAGELKKLGLEVDTQEGLTSGDWGNYTKAINIMARIQGKGAGKALMLLSHYDSREPSSLGASDAASGVATILEGIRAFLKEGKTPKNDIIILFTDAEEFGLNGAQLFVDKHPWAKETGLVLNFEARGSGGPSYMLIETNGGNAQLIKDFAAANPQYPVANSLAYSIYKMLPNDTDLTVFREDGDIEGFNFAFIDDHFDYHSALDTYERLDRNTLEHQGTYLMPLLQFFSNADLSLLKTDADSVYFNVPVFRLVSYPYSWIWPMFFLAVLFFLILVFYGIKKEALSWKGIARGFIPFILSLLVCGFIGYFGWPLLKKIYPEYNDILHGFTYNGHLYLATFAALSIALCFWIYSKFNKLKTTHLMVAPLFFWLLICGAVAQYLQGASFFIIPVIGALVAFMVLINQKTPHLILLVLLGVPALWILSPFVQMFPVGLGLKMMVAATTLIVLIFGLLLPVFGAYKSKKALALLGIIIAFGFFTAAHFQSDFNPERPKPNSLLYVMDANNQQAFWTTYDTRPDPWVKQYTGAEEKEDGVFTDFVLSSKYNTPFTYARRAPLKTLEIPSVEKLKDTLIDSKRHLQLCITPKRDVNRLEVFMNNKPVLFSCKVDGHSLGEDQLKNVQKNPLLFTYFMSGEDYVEIDLVMEANTPQELTVFEISNNLLQDPQFSIPARPENTIPMANVINDAIMIVKKVVIE